MAEHLNRTSYVGFVLASMNGKVDTARVMQICAFHDISEARISDLNYVHQKYTTRYEERAVQDLVASVPFGDEISKIIDEYEKRESYESKLVKDADNIELLLSLKEQMDTGNERAESWIPNLLPRLLTEEGRKLAAIIIKTDSDHWWYGEKNDGWWVHRNQKKENKHD